jgi:hypothetical protein
MTQVGKTRIASAVILITALLLFYVSNVAREAYLFPRVIAAVMVVLAGAMLVYEWGTGADRVRKIVEPVPWLTILPALAVFLAYLLLAERLGFYSTSSLAFFVLISIYSPATVSVSRTIRHLAITAAFIGALYVVFAVLLRVMTPRGLLF